MRPQTKRGIDARGPVLVPVGQETVDVEAQGIGVVFRAEVGYGGGDDDLIAVGNRVARQLEGVDDISEHQPGHRIQAQRFHQGPVRHVHRAQFIRCRTLAFEQRVRFGLHGVVNLGLLQHFVEHEGGRGPDRVEAGEEGCETADAKFVLRKELGVGAVQLDQGIDQIRLPVSA